MIKMNTEILNVINVVLNYKKFLYSYEVVLLNKKFDFISAVKKFYYSLDLPNDMNKNIVDFEAILNYGMSGLIEEINSLSNEELQERNWKNY